MNEKLKVILGTGCLGILLAFLIASVSFPGFGSFEKKISNYYIQQGWKELKASNVVTSIVWDFRGYDTLGEESVLFTAAIGVAALGFGLHILEKMELEKERK